MNDIHAGASVATLPSVSILLVRHAHTDAIGRLLAGRSAGVPLSVTGRAQADRLGRALASLPLAAIYTSPLERAVDTARAIARHQPVPIHEDAGLQEVDFGEWTGLTFDELAADERWRRFNAERATAAVPGGERASEVQQRVMEAIRRVGARHPDRTIVCVSHADVIRAAVLHIAGTSLDLYDRFEISPASVTALSLAGERLRLLYVNNTLLSTPAP
jgi:probable phosphoglycerate mutase